LYVKCVIHNRLAGSPSCSDDEALGRQIPKFELPVDNRCKIRGLREWTVELFEWLWDGPDSIKFNYVPGIRFAPMMPRKGGYWRSIAALIDSNVRSCPTWNIMASVPECASVGQLSYLPAYCSIASAPTPGYIAHSTSTFAPQSTLFIRLS
jgi:hypothetical protein